MKISEPGLDLWCRILTRIPEAELIVLDVPAGATERAFLARVAHRGVDPARITIRRRLPTQEYFDAIGDVDVALDAFPYNGATTTFDTLWTGVPLIALRGERGISRGSVSILRSLQLAELVAESPDAYVELNVRLARDASRLWEYRMTLRERLAASPLMNAKRFVADLETGYRTMWTTWCNA